MPDITTITTSGATLWVALGVGAGFGVAGAAHCAGMCGAFPLTLAAASKGAASRFTRALLYNGGRGLTYIVLASAAAAIGAAFGRATNIAEAGLWVGRALSVLAGLVIAGGGLFMLGVRLPFLGRGHAGGFIAESVARVGRGLVKGPGPAAPLALGGLNGLLPCPLVYMMLVVTFTLGAQAHLWQGVALGAGFAAGTVPVMLGIGLVGGPVAARMKLRLARVSGVLLLLFATLTVVRGVSLESIHNLIPGAHTLAHVMPDGRVMQKPAGMSEREYVEVVEREAEIVERIKTMLARNDRAGLDRLAATLSCPESKRCRIIDAADLAVIHASAAPEAEWAYRCECCGTPKPAKTGELYPGIALLFDADAPNPWAK